MSEPALEFINRGCIKDNERTKTHTNREPFTRVHQQPRTSDSDKSFRNVENPLVSSSTFGNDSGVGRGNVRDGTGRLVRRSALAAGRSEEL